MTTTCTTCHAAGYTLCADYDDWSSWDVKVPCHDCGATGEMSDCRSCRNPVAACDDYCTDCLAEEGR